MGSTDGGEVVRYRSTVARTAGVLYAVVLALIAVPVALTASGAGRRDLVRGPGAWGCSGSMSCSSGRQWSRRRTTCCCAASSPTPSCPGTWSKHVSVHQHTTKVVVGPNSYYGTGPGSRFLGVGLGERGREPVLRSDPASPCIRCRTGCATWPTSGRSGPHRRVTAARGSAPIPSADGGLRRPRSHVRRARRPHPNRLTKQIDLSVGSSESTWR